MRRNSRTGLIGSALIGIGGGAILILTAILGEGRSGVVPGILLVLLGVGAGVSFGIREKTDISEEGPPTLFTLDRTGLHLDPGRDKPVLHREWGTFHLTWLHKSGSYLELAGEGMTAQRWPVVVTDTKQPELAAAITELSDGRASLGRDSRPPKPRAA